MADTQLIIPLMEDALTVATLLIKAGYRVQMRKSKDLIRNFGMLE